MSSSLDTRFSRARPKESSIISRFVSCRPQDELIKITVINEYACRRPPPSVFNQKRLPSNMAITGISRSKGKPQTGANFNNIGFGNEQRFHVSTDAHDGRYFNTPSVRPSGSGRWSQHRGHWLDSCTQPVSICADFGISSTHRGTDQLFTRRGVSRMQANSRLTPRVLCNTALTRRGGTFAEPDILTLSDSLHPRRGSRLHMFDQSLFPAELHRGDGRREKNKNLSRCTKHPHYWKHDDRRSHNLSDTCWRSGPITDKSGFVHASIADEYIDDFTPEDLNKYKLDVNVGRSRRLAQNVSHSTRGRSTTTAANGVKPAVTPDQASEVGIPDKKIELRSITYINEHSDHPRYLTPAFQFWSDSGLGNSPRLRHVSLCGDESERNSVRLQMLSKLYRRKSWPHLDRSFPHSLTLFNESKQLLCDPTSRVPAFRSCPFPVTFSTLPSSSAHMRRYYSISGLSTDMSLICTGDSGMDPTSEKVEAIT